MSEVKKRTAEEMIKYHEEEARRLRKKKQKEEVDDFYAYVGELCYIFYSERFSKNGKRNSNNEIRNHFLQQCKDPTIKKLLQDVEYGKSGLLERNFEQKRKDEAKEKRESKKLDSISASDKPAEEI
jgi:hypothetical protein